MEITIYAKKKETKEGKKFYAFLTTLKRKDGTEQTMAVKFREDCGSPKGTDCPMNIIVDKKNANVSTREYEREDTGEKATAYTLWVNDWKEGAPFVDTSLDDFDV